MKEFTGGSILNLNQAIWKPRYAERMRNVQASEIRELLKLLDRPGVISFAGGIPDPALFPRECVSEAYATILGEDVGARRALQYSVSEGDPDLRSWIVGHMGRKGVPCGPENILITSGSQQALEFLGRLFISDGDTVAVTAPTYLGALQAFAPSQPTYAELRLRDETTVCLDGETADSRSGRHAFAYVVPDFANPTGETLSSQARRSILDLAAARDMPVIEDSPYEMLRYDGAAERPMQAMDVEASGGIDGSRVIYCGSFSKVFTPGLRIGWVCASREIVNKLTLIKQSSDLNSPALNQRVMLHLARRIYDEQVERACTVYRDKRDTMLAALGDVLPSGSRWSRPDGGMFVWVELPSTINATDLLSRAVDEHGVAFVPGRAFHADGRGANTLRLNFTLPAIEDIDAGLRRLAAALDVVAGEKRNHVGIPTESETK
jgi:DNA-binding transcriptional MocR family regulator